MTRIAPLDLACESGGVDLFLVARLTDIDDGVGFRDVVFGVLLPPRAIGPRALNPVRSGQLVVDEADPGGPVAWAHVASRQPSGIPVPGPQAMRASWPR